MILPGYPSILLKPAGVRWSPTTKALDDMFYDMLKDVYYAEKQILKALPKMAKAAKSPQLQKPSRPIAPRPKTMSSA